MVAWGGGAAMLLWAIACRPAGDGEVPADTTAPLTVPETGPAPTSPPDPCEVDPTLLVDVATTQPWHANELEVALTLSAPATAAVRCALADDPAEVHLAEATPAGTAHTLRLSGLLADADYECLAAAVCPATAAPTAFSVRTGPAPEGFVDVEVDGYAGAGTEYVLYNQATDCDYENQRLVVVDRQGRVRWWYSTPPWVGPSVEFRYHGDDRFEWGGGWDPNPLGRPRQVDLFAGELFDSAAVLEDAAGSDFHHDGKQLADGRLLTLERIDVDTGPGGPPPFDGFRVRRIDPVTGTVDFDWSSQRALDEGHLAPGWGDPWHANWVDVVDEVLYVSLCESQQVVAIDVATGDWLWSFGEDGDFALLEGEFPQCQHGAEMSSAGELLVYDNGVDRGRSRVAAYELDPDTWTATTSWTWSEPDWWETTLGDADWLPSGHVLVDMGHSDCFSSNPGDRTTIVEIDPASGDKLWQLRFVQRDQTAYRADWADPCALFDNAAVCPTVADRLAALATVFGGS